MQHTALCLNIYLHKGTGNLGNVLWLDIKKNIKYQVPKLTYT